MNRVHKTLATVSRLSSCKAPSSQHCTAQIVLRHAYGATRPLCAFPGLDLLPQPSALRTRHSHMLIEAKDPHRVNVTLLLFNIGEESVVHMCQPSWWTTVPGPTFVRDVAAESQEPRTVSISARTAPCRCERSWSGGSTHLRTGALWSLYSTYGLKMVSFHST